MSYQPNFTDPNWLLATIVQSASTIFAVIGGFLVNRIFSYKSDKEELLKDLEKIKVMIAESEAKLIKKDTHETIGDTIRNTIKHKIELEKIKNFIEKKIQDKPIWLIVGGIILILYSLFVIIVPLFMMPASSETFTPENKNFVLCSFSIGLIVILCYLFFSFRSLYKKKK